MTQSEVGVVYIGRSPRPSVERELRAVLGEGVALRVAGALDGLFEDEIAALAPQGDEEALFTRLPDDRPIILRRAAVEERLGDCITGLRVAGIETVVLACTGEFAGLAPSPRLLYPSRLLEQLVAALKPQKLGVFTPLKSLVEQTTRKWAARGYDTQALALTPLPDNPAADDAANQMAEHRPDLLVFDCISYDRATRARVTHVLPVPALLAVTAVARIAAETLG